MNSRKKMSCFSFNPYLGAMERYIVAKESYDENPNNDGQESGRRQLYRRTKISPRKALHEISKNELLSPVKKSPSKGILNKNGILKKHLYSNFQQRNPI